METIRTTPVILITGSSGNDLKQPLKALKDERFILEFATTPEETLDKVVSAEPDLILMDTDISAMNGYDLCRQLTSIETEVPVPVVFILSERDDSGIETALSSGASDVITEPVLKDELIARLNVHIDLKRSRESVDRLTLNDELLNIPNKRFFNRYFEYEWKCAIREKSPLSVLMIDIDRFKSFNDTYGHLEGDRCLLNVSMALQACMSRPGDFIARFGGEQFVCVLPHTDRNGALKVAEEIRSSVESLALVTEEHGGATSVTVSIGSNTAIPENSQDMIQFISDTDKVLYTAKNTGRNRVCAV